MILLVFDKKYHPDASFILKLSIHMCSECKHCKKFSKYGDSGLTEMWKIEILLYIFLNNVNIKCLAYLLTSVIPEVNR